MTRGLSVAGAAMLLTVFSGILVAADASSTLVAVATGFAPSVLASLFFAERMTFVLSPVLIAALALAAIAIWQISGDGRAMPFEGWALVALYVVLATLVWFE
jgi:Ca2+/H+ antiporter